MENKLKELEQYKTHLTFQGGMFVAKATVPLKKGMTNTYTNLQVTGEKSEEALELLEKKIKEVLNK